MAPTPHRPDADTRRTSESERKDGFKPIFMAAILASLLLLGGCVRFGPQAEEMEKTASQAAKTDVQEENGTTNGASPEANSVSTSTEANPDDETQTDEEQETNSSDTGDTQADRAAGSGEKNGKESVSKDKPEIEAIVNRDDTQSMVTVELQLLPPGYSLVSMSWEPAVDDPANRTDVSSQTGQPIPGSAAATNGTSGQPSPSTGSASSSSTAASERVTTTYHDAVLAGQAGSNGFFIDQDGQRIGYRYTLQQKGRSGTLRLEFRDSEGSNVAWEKTVMLGTANSPIDETEQQGG